MREKSCHLSKRPLGDDLAQKPQEGSSNDPAPALLSSDESAGVVTSCDYPPQRHAFFSCYDWQKTLEREYRPEFVPPKKRRSLDVDNSTRSSRPSPPSTRWCRRTSRRSRRRWRTSRASPTRARDARGRASPRRHPAWQGAREGPGLRPHPLSWGRVGWPLCPLPWRLAGRAAGGGGRQAGRVYVLVEALPE
jgi:hypothetical protein